MTPSGGSNIDAWAAAVERDVLAQFREAPCTIHYLRARLRCALEEDIREAVQRLLDAGFIEPSRAGRSIMEGCWQVTEAGALEP
jgi:hypothetical protein